MHAQEYFLSDLFTGEARFYQPDDLKFTIGERNTQLQQFFNRINLLETNRRKSFYKTELQAIALRIVHFERSKISIRFIRQIHHKILNDKYCL
jgi:hypothetical protein